jgi:hypothetical protein
MFKKYLKFTLTAIVILLIIFVLAYRNQNFLIKKGYQIAPKIMHKVRFFYFNLPNNLPSIPSSDPLLSDLEFKKSLKNLTFKNSHFKKIKIFDEIKKIQFYMPKENYLMSGISNKYAGSSYIEFFNNKLFLLSSRGLTGYGEISDNEIILNQIENNLNLFLGKNEFEKDISFSFKDTLIHNNKVFVTFTDEITKNCWSISVLQSDINYNYLNFKYIFRSSECIEEENDEAFVSIQSGGRIVALNQENLLLSIGDFRVRKRAQDLSSIFGKIIKIDLTNQKHRIVTIGHRNPQGLYIDIKNNIVLSTEHGPIGGDEINVINLKDIANQNVLNFGWPIASYGEHYAKKTAITEEQIHKLDLLYQKYPLKKSHEDFGFIEPIYYFTPSIGISEIVGFGNSEYMSSSLGGKKLFFFKLDEKNEIKNYYIENIGERVRDVIFKNDKLIFFLEDTATIAVINF